MISNLEYYRAFYYVAIYGSFSIAATALHLTQSAVSQSVKKLEKELDTTLFFRGHHTITLTPSGSILHKHIQKAFASIQFGEQALSDHEALEKKTLVLGATETSICHFLPDLLHRFQEIYPRTHITMKGSYTEELIQLLLEHKLELAFLILSEERKNEKNLSGLYFKKYRSIQDVVVVSRSLAFNSKKFYTLPELISTPFISVTGENSVRRLFDAWFAQENLIFQPEYTVRSMGLVLSLVENGLGFGIMPREFAIKGIQKGTLMELKTTTLPTPRSLYISYSATTSLSERGKDFLSLLETNNPFPSCF